MSWFLRLCQSFRPRFGGIFVVPSSVRILLILLLAGVGLFAAGLISPERTRVYEDDIIGEFINVILVFSNGTAGALLMIGSGIAAILLAVLRCYRVALCFVFLAFAVFFLRNGLVENWTDHRGITEGELGSFQRTPNSIS